MLTIHEVSPSFDHFLNVTLSFLYLISLFKTIKTIKITLSVGVLYPRTSLGSYGSYTVLLTQSSKIIFDFQRGRNIVPSLEFLGS